MIGSRPARPSFRSARAALLALATGAALALGARPAAAHPAAQDAAAAAPAGQRAAAEVAAGSPNASLREFLELCRTGRWNDAAQFLDVPAERHGERGVLARRLKAVFDRYLWFDLDHISPRPEGDLEDGLPPDVEEVGRIPNPNGLQEPVRLAHLDAGESSRWVFSAATVEKIDGWFATLPDRWVLEYLPPQLLQPGPADLLWWHWLAMPLVLLLSWVLGALLGRLTRAVLGHLVRRTTVTWDDLLLERLAGPLTIAWSLVVLRVLVRALGLYKPAEDFIGIGVHAGLTLVFFWALLRSVDVLRDALGQSEWARSRSGMQSLLPLGARVLKALVLGMGVVGVLSLMGFPVASLIAGLGVGGIALALAAQKTGENLFAAFAIGVDKPFSEGDLVRVDDVEGVVEQIGLRSTRLRTGDRTLVTMPNSRIAEARLESLTARDRLRFAQNFGLVYGTSAAQVRAILRGIEQVLLEERDLWPDVMVVAFKGLGESALDFETMAWFRTTNIDEFRRIRERVLLGIMEVVEREGSSFAYPTRTVQVVGEKPGLAAR